MCAVRLLIIKYINVKVYLRMEITLIVALQNTEMISSKSFLVDRSCVIQPAPPPPLSLLSFFLSLCVCVTSWHLCVGVDQGTGAGAASQGLFLYWDRYFLHVSACSSRACVSVCLGMWSYSLLDQTVQSGMWLGQLDVFQHPPLFLHAVLWVSNVCMKEDNLLLKWSPFPRFWRQDGMKALITRWNQFLCHLRWQHAMPP